MSFDLILIRDCDPREELDNGELTAISNALMFLEELHQESAFDATMNQPPPDDVPLSNTDPPMALGDLRARVRQAIPQLAPCATCPLNIGGRLVGCHTRVDYPIPAAVERQVADSATAAASDSMVAEALMARTPVAKPKFRTREAGMFEGSFAPWVKVPWNGETKAVSLDAFWDLLLEPRVANDGVAVARVLTRLQQDLGEEGPDDPSLAQLTFLAYALRVFVASAGEAGYAVSG